MSCYLVTGGAGFIGSAVCNRLISQGHRVVTIDNLTTGSLNNLPAKAEFYQADCQDKSIYSKIPNIQYDAIFHIAGQSSGEISFDDPVYDLRTNTESVLHLLKFALSVNCNRFIYASTMSVYGVKVDRQVKEDEGFNPESFYGVGKLASEHYIRIYERYGIRSTSLRLFNVYGPGQNMANLRQGMLSIFMAQMIKNKHIHVKGSKDRFRDFVYIEDVVDAFILCLEKEDSCGKIFNIGTGIRTTVEELINKMTSLYPHDVSIEFKGNTPGDIMGIYPDISLARKVLGFSPKYDLKHGLKKMIQ